MAASVKTGSAAIKETGTQQQVNILVVDDLPEKHVVFRTILDELDQNIVSARSGQEALGCILEMEFAVILLDVNMPDIDGLETAGLIRQYRKSAQTPIVFITAYVDEIQARRAALQRPGGLDFHMVDPADVNLPLSMLADPQQIRRDRALTA